MVRLEPRLGWPKTPQDVKTSEWKHKNILFCLLYRKRSSFLIKHFKTNMTRCTSIFGDASLQQLNQEIFLEVWELMSCERRVISKNTVVNMKKWAGRPVYYIYIYI